MLALERKHFVREPRLADASGTDEGDEPLALQGVAHGAELDVAADELSRERSGSAALRERLRSPPCAVSSMPGPVAAMERDTGRSSR